MWMFGWRFLAMTLGSLPLILGILLFPIEVRGQDAQQPPATTETLDNTASIDTAVSLPETPSENPQDILPEALQETLMDEEPTLPTLSDEILAPLEEPPTLADEILAPLEEDMENEIDSGDGLTVPGPQKHIVQPGDTLWDITHTYFKDSFLWPKLWKTNKDILDPDLIYPGNIILLPGETSAPLPPSVQAAPGTRVTRGAQSTPDDPQPGLTTKEAQVAPIRGKSRIKIIRPEVTSPQEFSLDLSKLPNPGYVVVKEKSIGKVVGARDNREIFGENEITYLLPKRGQKPAIGDLFTVYRSVHRVKHPQNGKNLGSLVRILGTLEVTGVEPREKTVTAYVLNSLDFIRPGDLYMPLLKGLDTKNIDFSTSVEGSLDGFIIEVQEDRVGQAQHDFVFLDRGLNDGLEIGNRFIITRIGDKTGTFSPGRGVRLPSRMIGQIQVISVQDITATALILNSTEVILRGDRFESPAKP